MQIMPSTTRSDDPPSYAEAMSSRNPPPYDPPTMPGCPQAVAVDEHGVVEAFQQLVDSGRLVSHQVGNGFLSKVGEACTAQVIKEEGIVEDFGKSGDGQSITTALTYRLKGHLLRHRVDHSVFLTA